MAAAVAAIAAAGDVSLSTAPMEDMGAGVDMDVDIMGVLVGAVVEEEGGAAAAAAATAA